MFSHLQLREIESDDSREGARYLSKGHGRFTGDTAQPVACDIINISYSGAAVKCYGTLRIGEKYKIDILGLGAFPCHVVRSFDADSFGIRFDISLEGKLRLRKRLDEMFQQAHSDSNNPNTVRTTVAPLANPSTTPCFKRVMLAPDVGDAIDFARKTAADHKAKLTIVESNAIRVSETLDVERVLVTEPNDGATRQWIVKNAGADTIVITRNVLLSFECLNQGAMVYDSEGKAFDASKEVPAAMTA
ncbi:MAG: DUF188 domain-containing protein [Pseudomonadota bacterium]